MRTDRGARLPGCNPGSTAAQLCARGQVYIFTYRILVGGMLDLPNKGPVRYK